MKKNKAAAFRMSLTVGIVLAILTVIEYYIGIHYPSVVFLFLLALLKGMAVVYYFMHITRVWSSEGGH
jgi:hypothetical protein